jgi:hypothetical protein
MVTVVDEEEEPEKLESLA